MKTVLYIILGAVVIYAPFACFAVWVALQPSSYPENHEHVSGDFR